MRLWIELTKRLMTGSGLGSGWLNGEHPKNLGNALIFVRYIPYSLPIIMFLRRENGSIGIGFGIPELGLSAPSLLLEIAKKFGFPKVLTSQDDAETTQKVSDEVINEIEMTIKEYQVMITPKKSEPSGGSHSPNKPWQEPLFR